MKKLIISLFVMLITHIAMGQFNTTLGPITSQTYPYTFKIHETDSFYFLRSASFTTIDIIKVDKQGNMLKKLTVPGNAYYGVSSVVSGRKIVIVSSVYDTSNHFYGKIVVLNFNLDTLLTKKVYGNYILSSYLPNGVSQNTFQAIVQTPDKGFIIGGAYSAAPGNSLLHPYLIKTDSLFNVQWYRDLMKTGTIITKLSLTHDLGILMFLSCNTYGIIKTNALGYVQWDKTPLKPDLVHFISDFAYAGNGDYIFVTLWKYKTANTVDYYGYYIRKINGLTGQIIWDTTYTPLVNICVHPSLNGYSPLKVSVLSDGRIEVFGIGETPNLLSPSPYSGYMRNGFGMILSPNGDSLKTDYYFCAYDSIWSLKHSDLFDVEIKNDTIITGFGLYLSETHTGYDSVVYWFFSNGLGGFTGIKSFNNFESNNISITPNPVSDICNFSLNKNIAGEKMLKIFSYDGKLILQKTFKVNASSLDLSSYPTGIYLAIIDTKKGKYFGKFVKSR